MTLLRRSAPAVRGFTLIEVLVALAIVAIALATGVQASNALVQNAQRQSDVLLGQLCADNALVRMRLSKQMPAVGDSSFTCDQAARTRGGTLSVFVTPNPNFRRVEVKIRESASAGAYTLLTVSTVVGRY